MSLLSWKCKTLALFSFILLGLCPALHAGGLPPVAPPNVAEQLLLTQANADRIAHGLQPVERDPLLSQAAAYHAIQMARHGDISHGFPGEPELSERGASAGVHFSLITENVAEAEDANIIHGLWMRSPGHRRNLLDPEVNVVGLAVVVQNRQVFAVEDFASTVQTLSLEQQESTVATLLRTSGIFVSDNNPKVNAETRQTCSMESGYAGHHQPWFIMRYVASDLSTLPDQLKSHLGTGRYHVAAVGACPAPASEVGPFAAYNIAVLLYP